MVPSMHASRRARQRKAITAEEHQAAHLRDVLLCAFERADHRAVFLAAEVIGNIAEPPEQLMVKRVGVPEELLPDRHYRCLWFVHRETPFLVPPSLSRRFVPP